MRVRFADCPRHRGLGVAAGWNGDKCFNIAPGAFLAAVGSAAGRETVMSDRKAVLISFAISMLSLVASPCAFTSTVSDESKAAAAYPPR